MKHMLLLLLLAATTPHASFSQSNPEVASWVANHPNVYIISFDNFQKMSEARKEQLKDQMIVFQGELKMEQLMAYSAEKSLNEAGTVLTKDQDAQELKDWLSAYSDVKIIKRSVFDNMSSGDQTMYLQQNALILIGEKLTVQDIRNYHY